MSHEPPYRTDSEPSTLLFDQKSNLNGNGSSSSPKKKHTGKPKPGRNFLSVEDVVASLTDDPWEREKMPLIWKYYCLKTERGDGYQPTEKRLRLGIERLRDLVNFSGKEGAREGFRLAIDNLAANDFLAGNNDRQTEYREFDKHLCKDWETLELRMREEPTKAKGR